MNRSSVYTSMNRSGQWRSDFQSLWAVAPRDSRPGDVTRLRCRARSGRHARFRRSGFTFVEIRMYQPVSQYSRGSACTPALRCHDSTDALHSQGGDPHQRILARLRIALRYARRSQTEHCPPKTRHPCQMVSPPSCPSSQAMVHSR
jgi:hypothetical protein